jgi:hypothetical protein
MLYWYRSKKEKKMMGNENRNDIVTVAMVAYK